MKPTSTLIAALGLISLVLAGCASTKDTVLPQDGPSMKAIYEGHVHEMNADNPQVIRGELGSRPIVAGEAALHGYTRDAFNEIDVLFPRLPNPTLVMYIFPHLAGDAGAPVPGYTTAFPMYEQVEYALPGEVRSHQGGIRR
ncbi:MAG: TIGR03751 family conjugal transfer lipoprotein [Candidatus Thiodiazotropha endolucinida]|nr:TIGR03751 family conjugal transfer lipoprotein [Candidatus Thiodiazotropha taylori]MCG8058227.1 TIGR03751 family conjugal transfer lipoprotein [Candidatus Thiodiazotropha taylori]MCW4266568.1 TIGR03751 family conjugal transfer lipoprotein [Candidatus Thiodiazotropha endolucinida]MCW4347364.1 TIGR03751 family conjugal transfer lipoprotein [Candidatus Thiodiazotropha endolucinida]